MAPSGGYVTTYVELDPVLYGEVGGGGVGGSVGTMDLARVRCALRGIYDLEIWAWRGIVMFAHRGVRDWAFRIGYEYTTWMYIRRVGKDGGARNRCGYGPQLKYMMICGTERIYFFGSNQTYRQLDVSHPTVNTKGGF